MDILDLIAVPDDVAAMPGTDGGREVLELFSRVDSAFPDFFPYLAQMGGVGMPNALEGDAAINEGKRVLALEALAILRVANTPFEEAANEE